MEHLFESGAENGSGHLNSSKMEAEKREYETNERF
jgi:hypothetical protein